MRSFYFVLVNLQFVTFFRESIRKEIDDLKKSYKDDKKRSKADSEPIRAATSSKSEATVEENALILANKEEMKKYKSKYNFPKKGEVFL